MAQGSQITGNNMKKCSIITTKIPRIICTVENVSKIPKNSKVKSSEFYLTPKSKCYLNLLKSSSCFYVYIYNKSDAKIQIERTIVLHDVNDKKLHEERDANICSLEKKNTVYLTTAVSKEIFQNLTNDTVIIDLCVKIKEDSTKELNRLLCDAEPEKKLRKDLKTMLENPVNSDVCLRVGDERILAHWPILCSRSPYFKKMFDSGMQESVKNSVIITDSSFGTVKKLIQFLYTADFILIDDLQELLDLYYAADKYEVLDLRQLCACNIMNNVTADNVCQILLLAHRHNDKFLQMEVMDFIQLNSNAVFRTEGWEKFKRSEPLAAEFCSFFCMKKK